jgi:hypothetical protein
MKNNSKLIYLAIVVIVIAVVGNFIFSNKNDDGYAKKQSITPEKNISNISASSVNNESSGNMQNIPYGTPPKWAQSIMDINDNPIYSREDKIQKLVELLKQNESNVDALSAILISLTALNPIEVAEDIIPYLKNLNPKVQSAALGALNNASLLTQKEHEIKGSLPENDAIRKRVAEAVNELRSAPDITNEVKQALISNYAATNPSLKDTQTMNQEILNQDSISPNEASFIASSILNGKGFSNTLITLGKKDAIVKDEVISSIGANLSENTDVVSALSSQQRTELINFIRNNPPQSKGDNFGYQNDQWNNTLNVIMDIKTDL